MMSTFGSRGDRHTTTVTATSSQTITQQQGSTVTVNLRTKAGNFPGASLVIDANRLKGAEQQAKLSGTATVEATVEVKGSRNGVPVTLRVTKTTTTSTPTVEQQGATVKVNLGTGATLVINIETLTQAVQQAEASGTATVSSAVQQAEVSATATAEANCAAVTNTVTATGTQTVTQRGSTVKITF